MKRIERKMAIVVVLVALTSLAMQVSTWAGFWEVPLFQQQPSTRLGFIPAVLVALGYWWTNSAFTANLGFNVFRWPLMAGTVVGLIMGDLGQGILIGANINLVFLGVISAGGSQPADPALAGWVGTALALAANLGPQEAIAIAAPLGVLGLINYFSRMSVDVGFVRLAEERAERGDIWGVARANWLPPQLYLFVVYFLPALILAIAGSTALNALFDAIDPARGGSANWRWVRDWFIIAGSILTAVGISINLQLILTRATIPYFLIFFTVSALTDISVVAIAVIAAALALLHVTIIRRRQPDVTTAS